MVPSVTEALENKEIALMVKQIVEEKIIF